jgi:hypothetical protein
MSLTVQNLGELDVTTVQQTVDTLTELLQEDNPTLDLKRGVLHDLLLYYSGILATANQENIDRVRRSSSLLAIEEDPSLAEDDVVDRVLSNFRIERRVGAAATGSVTIVVDALESLTIPSGAVFEATGKEFQTTLPFTAVISEANITSDTDKILTARGDGTYFFAIDVEAIEEGTDGLLKKDTLLVPQIGILNFVKAYAASDFVDGTDTETNGELLLRLQEGLAAKTLSNRLNMSALIRENFPDIVHMSIIGYGDAEQLRDQHSIFPISYGGRVDVYVRTQLEPQLLGLTKEATLVSTDSDDRGTWQISMDRDEASGFYDITAIKPLDADEAFGSFEITLETRSLDTENIAGELTPDLQDVDEGSYSRYQTGVIRYYDTETDTSALAVGDVQDVSVTVRVMQDVADIQTLLGNRSTRNYAGDVLVKAAVPCFVSLAFTLQGKPGVELPDADEIKEALAQYVNQTGFSARLHASALSDIIHDFLPENVAISAIDMFGQIRRPDGTVKPLRSKEVLIIPDEPERMVSSRTTVFILNTEDIAVSAETVNIPEI